MIGRNLQPQPSSTNDAEIPSDPLADFDAAARRPLELRVKYAFIKTRKPVLDDATYRSFDTMEDYRRRCEENLPEYLFTVLVCDFLAVP